MSDMNEQTDAFNLGSDNSAAENSTTLDGPHLVALPIPVAVYTANRGYDWSNVPEIVGGVDEADKLFDEIISAKSPYFYDLLPLGDAFKGVLYTGEKYAFAFRLMTAPSWDQVKRPAYYCASAFVRVEDLDDVDFEKLLDMDFFKIPRHDPPATLDYSDEDYFPPSREDCYSAIVKLRDEGKCDWKLIGRILSEFGAECRQWLFARIIRNGEIKDVSKFEGWRPSSHVDHEDDLAKNEIPYGIGIQPNAEPPDVDMGRIEESLMPTAEMMADNHLVDECAIRRTAESESIAEYAAAYEDLERYCDQLQNENNRLKIAVQTISQERDSARSVSQNLRIRIKNMEIRVGSQNPSVNWPLLILAFLLGVIVFLGIQLLAGFNGDDRPHDGASYTEDQSEEYQ